MLLWAPRCTHGADLGHIWSEITSRKQDDFAGVSRQSRLRRRVCQHFPFASAAVQKDTKIESGHVCQVIVVSIHFFFFFLSTVPVVIFLSGRLHCVKCCHQGCWGGQHWHRGIVHAKSFLMGDICGMIRAGWDQGDNSVAPFRCDSESFKGSVCHIWKKKQ